MAYKRANRVLIKAPLEFVNLLDNLKEKFSEEEGKKIKCRTDILDRLTPVLEKILENAKVNSNLNKKNYKRKLIFTIEIPKIRL